MLDFKNIWIVLLIMSGLFIQMLSQLSFCGYLQRVFLHIHFCWNVCVQLLRWDQVLNTVITVSKEQMSKVNMSINFTWKPTYSREENHDLFSIGHSKTTSSNLQQAKVKSVIKEEINLLISTLSKTPYHLAEHEQIQHCSLY